MIGPFEVVWSDLASEDLTRMPWREAARIVAAVQRWAETGEGTILATEGAEYALFVGVHAVVMLIDGDTLHVDHVRRA